MKQGQIFHAHCHAGSTFHAKRGRCLAQVVAAQKAIVPSAIDRWKHWLPTGARELSCMPLTAAQKLPAAIACLLQSCGHKVMCAHRAACWPCNSFCHACTACSCSGVLQLLKLPSLNGLAPPVPETTTFIIRHRRRRLAIQVILRLQSKDCKHLNAGAKQDVSPHTALRVCQHISLALH